MCAESHTDACIYHELPLFGYFKDGGSPLAVGVEMRERWHGRVFLYGGISPHQSRALERVDQLVDEYDVAGLQFARDEFGKPRELEPAWSCLNVPAGS